MMPGSTPTHIFNLPIDTSIIGSLRITYAQNREKVLTKEMSDCTLSGKAVTVKLTQEDTLLFKNEIPTEIQIHVLTQENEAIVSRLKRVPTGVLLDREVLT